MLGRGRYIRIDIVAAAAVLAAAPAPRDDAAEVLRRLNAERAAAGARALVASALLDRVARARAEEVAAAGDLDRAGESGPDISRRANAAGYWHELVEEFVTAGEGTPDDRIETWREKWPKSFAEAMDPRYRDVGIGLVRRDDELVSVVVVGLASSDAFAERTARLADLRRVRDRMLAGVNGEREALRLSPLRESPVLDQAAQAHAEDMIRRSYYGHESPEGATALDRARRSGYRAATVGENIAEGQSTADEVLEGWMKSPVHREHIVSLVYRDIGLGMAYGKNVRGYEIVWVQEFGAARSYDSFPQRSRRKG